MSKILYERELVNLPSPPYILWDEQLIKQKLELRGFDMEKPIEKVYDSCLGSIFWRQR